MCRSLLIISASLLLLSGCSSKKLPETISVEGVVKLEGAPVEGARVMFVPKGSGRPAEGQTDKAGRFELSTFAPRDGALPGEHTVTVTLVRAAAGASARTFAEGSEEAAMLAVSSGVEKPPEWIVPMKYSAPSSSGLSATVSAQSREFTFDLKKRP